MKSENLLHKRGFVDSLLQTTVTLCTLGRHVNAVKLFFAHYKFWRNDDHGEHNYSVAIFIYGSNSPNEGLIGFIGFDTENLRKHIGKILNPNHSDCQSEL